MLSHFSLVSLFLSLVVLLCSWNGAKAQKDNSILNHTPPLDLQKNLPYFLSGVDKEGAPVWVFEFGRWDIRTLAAKRRDYPKEIEKYTDTMFQKMHASAKSFGVDGIILVVDMDGYDFRQFTSYHAIQSIYNQARQFVKANPGGKGIKRVYIVNSNRLFETAYGLVKPILGQLTKQIDLYGENPETWMPVLLKEIPQRSLPVWLGGSPKHVPIQVFG